MTNAPWRILDIDLAEGPRDLAADGSPHLLVLWWRSLPIGTLALARSELPFSAAQLADAAAPMLADQALARTTARYAGEDGAPQEPAGLDAAMSLDVLGQLDAVAPAPPPCADRLSVIVCTRDRPQQLAACLDSLATQAALPGQVVVVDNSGGGSAREICARPGVTYLHEPAPGLSRARNAGLAAARGDLLAFTDDDVELAPSWTQEVVRAFDDVSVDAVTGLVLPARLDTPAQRAFEIDLGGFTSRHFPIRFDSRFLEVTRHMGPQVWRIGAGANMAFRRSVFARLGGFDERLGAGASGCSEDSEFWYRILAAGGVCLYEPRAVVRHHHRSDWQGLRRQLRAYMAGHVAALVAQADRYGHRGNIRRIFRQLPVYFARKAMQAVQNLQGWRLRLLWAEVVGWAIGLTYLLRPRWRRIGRASRSRAASPAATAEVRHA